MLPSLGPWIAFLVFVLLMLALDLGVFHRKSHVVSLKEAAAWSAVWVTLALAFNGLIYAWKGPQAGLEFLTGYLIEKSLSVDNIFVFVLIFTFFAVPAIHQHRVLFWGILGALLMRGALIGVGAVLIERFHWILYVFGAFLVITAIKMLLVGDREMDPAKNPVLKLARKVLPIAETYHGERFFLRDGRRWIATPLLLVLLLIETSDLIFAVDSIPAIFAVTRDPFLVFTSNIFAILGLRSLYFLLAGVVTKLVFLKTALAGILGFVGTKMVLADVIEVPITVSLLVIAGVLAVAVVASLLKARREEGKVRVA